MGKERPIRGPYFEGWYLKCRTAQGEALALIPAYHVDRQGRWTASLQVITAEGSWWLEYPDTALHIERSPLQISLGPNTFGEKGLSLQVEEPGLSLCGTLDHGEMMRLKSDIMGPFRFLSGMECSHSVVSMGHRLTGKLDMNGKTMDYSGGRGYMESDRGRSFPDPYLWTQCNWPDLGPNGLFLAIATIPLIKGVRFTGCICAICDHGEEYRLATYMGVKIRTWSDRGAELLQGKYRLRVDVLEKAGQPLRAPTDGIMKRTIHESLCSQVRCRFWVGDRLLFDRIDKCAGYEYTSRDKRAEI